MTPIHYWIEVESEFRGTTAKVGMSMWTREVSNFEVAEVSGGRRNQEGHIYVWLNRGLILKTQRKEEAIGCLRRLMLDAPTMLQGNLTSHIASLERAVVG
jgi:hypothetical protein